MAHHAKVLDGNVVKVIVAEASFFDNFIDNSPGTWIQTSYNTRGGIHYQPNTNITSSDQSLALRGNYATIGDIYDSTLDVFLKPKPYPSWILDETTYTWNAPISKPTASLSMNQYYEWNESSNSWELKTND